MSPLKTVREVDARRMIKIAFLAGFGAMLANSAALVIFVSRLDALRIEDKQTSREAREDMCAAMVSSFELYTEALIVTFDSVAVRDDKAQAEFDAIADGFRHDMRQNLPDCESLPA